jgi:tetratricopeptide (TPR) repeat protein
MITRRGVPKILDFGLAKPILQGSGAVPSGATTDLLTQEGRVVGTPSFMSPEQLEGREVDHRSDIFSLGIILYEMATGRRPYSGSTEAEIVSSILRDSPDPADKVRPELPHHLGRLLRLCLEKKVGQRMQSARDLRNELMELRRELTTGEIEVRAARAQDPPVMRWQRWLMVALLVVLMASVVTIGVRHLANRSDAAADIGREAQDLVYQAQAAELRGYTRDNLREAEERYRRALELEPGSTSITGSLALLLARIQEGYPEPGRAIEIVELVADALREDPKMASALVARGTLHLLAGEIEDAESAARSAREAAPEDYIGYTLLGKVLAAQGRMDESLVELRRGVDLAGPDVRARLILAGVLISAGELDAAASVYREVLDYDPHSPTALNNLAIVYLRTGRDRDAIVLFNRLLSLYEDEAAALNLGIAYLNLGQIDEAIGSLKRAHELVPEKPLAPYAIGEAYETKGDSENAELWYAKALGIYDERLAAGGRQSRVISLRAVCAAKLGRFDEAITGVEEALEAEPGNGEFLFNAAKVYAMAGRHAEAYRFTAQSLEAGYARQEFARDLAFGQYLSDAAYQRILESMAN